MLRAPSIHEARAPRRLRLFIALCLSLLSSAVQAQAILVAPQGVVLSNRERTGSVELYNPGTRAAEITIRAVFGHPTTTPDGEHYYEGVTRNDGLVFTPNRFDLVAKLKKLADRFLLLTR